MRAKEVYTKLGVNAVELHRLVSDGKIRRTEINSRVFEYNEEDVEKVFSDKPKTLVLVPPYPFQHRLIKSWLEANHILNTDQFKGDSTESLYKIICTITNRDIDRLVTYKLSEIFTDRERQVLELLCRDNRVEIISVSELEDTKR